MPQWRSRFEIVELSSGYLPLPISCITNDTIMGIRGSRGHYTAVAPNDISIDNPPAVGDFASWREYVDYVHMLPRGEVARNWFHILQRAIDPERYLPDEVDQCQTELLDHPTIRSSLNRTECPFGLIHMYVKHEMLSTIKKLDEIMDDGWLMDGQVMPTFFYMTASKKLSDWLVSKGIDFHYVVPHGDRLGRIHNSALSLLLTQFYSNTEQINHLGLSVAFSKSRMRGLPAVVRICSHDSDSTFNWMINNIDGKVLRQTRYGGDNCLDLLFKYKRFDRALQLIKRHPSIGWMKNVDTVKCLNRLVAKWTTTSWYTLFNSASDSTSKHHAVAKEIVTTLIDTEGIIVDELWHRLLVVTGNLPSSPITRENIERGYNTMLRRNTVSKIEIHETSWCQRCTQELGPSRRIHLPCQCTGYCRECSDNMSDKACPCGYSIDSAIDVEAFKGTMEITV